MDPCEYRVHLREAVNPRPCWNEPTHVPSCLLSCLETFQWSQYEGREEEIKVAQFIIRNSACLKNAAFYPKSCREAWDANRIISVTKEFFNMSAWFRSWDSYSQGHFSWSPFDEAFKTDIPEKLWQKWFPLNSTLDDFSHFFVKWIYLFEPI